jgi:hypothetical protein
VHRENIEAIMDWPPPKNISHFHGFFEICSYYRKFVKGFSYLATPVINLTNKGVFREIDESQRKFEKMKEVMRTCPVLALPDFTKPFVLDYDASSEGIGASLFETYIKP